MPNYTIRWQEIYIQEASVHAYSAEEALSRAKQGDLDGPIKPVACENDYYEIVDTEE